MMGIVGSRNEGETGFSLVRLLIRSLQRGRDIDGAADDTLASHLLLDRGFAHKVVIFPFVAHFLLSSCTLLSILNLFPFSVLLC